MSKDYKMTSKRCWGSVDTPSVDSLKNEKAKEMAKYAITLLDEFESYTRGRLLTYIESLGGEELTVKSRKDMIHFIMNDLKEDLNGAGRHWGKKTDQAIEFGKGNELKFEDGIYPFDEKWDKVSK